MKAQFLFVYLLLVSVFSLAQAPTNGLVAYYPFTGNANDASGNNRHGTIEGSVSLTVDRLGIPNQAYEFNGIYADIITSYSGWSILTGNAARTISVWFKTTLPSQYPQYMVSWGYLDNNQSSNLGTYMDGPNSTKYLGFFPTNVNAIALADAVQYYNNQWHLMTFTHDGSTMKLYLDGTLQKTATNVTLNTAISALAIGRFTTGPYYFAGSLDEVRIYNRALTDMEIQQMYTAEAPVPPLAEFAKIGSNRFIHTIGQFNTSIGNMAGNAITNNAGTRNTFMGYQSGRDNSAGSYNTFIGYQAGYLTTSGGNNVFLGANANPIGNSAATLQNTVALGANAKVAISDAIVLGDTTNTNIKVGIGTAAPRYPLDVKGNINIRRGPNGAGKLIFASRSSIQADEQEYIVLTGGKAGESGLRLANLSNQATPVSMASQFLSVDGQGRVGLYQPTVTARQVRLQVAHSSDWADHVFATDYPLMSLSQVGEYTRKYQHLPHLPSAQVMAEKGATMEELVKGLVKTQEEQTRHLLQLQAENEQLRKENVEIRALLKQVLEKK